MTKKTVNTTPCPGGGWQNISSGAQRPPKIFDYKYQAQPVGRITAINQKAEHIIHKANGKIQDANSYSNDPRKVKG